LRNDSWTFESIRATHGIPLSAPTPRKYAYEVLLRTEGLIQVGWTARDSLFDPEGGTGVGDDDLSYGYDGFRAKKWHGRWSDECAYGLVWTVGDVVTTTIDLDERTIHYYLNGKDMGIAFENVDGQLVWFPVRFDYLVDRDWRCVCGI
ncbi:concanavalin A-like lectin/glucanase domain-containing protein, partial [Jimgerdemannia flammicorona]